MTATLKHGDKGQPVTDLQNALNKQGAQLRLDGIYGDATERAVKAYQLKAGLVADGIAGSKTQARLLGINDNKHLQHSDLVKAAGQLEVSLASVYAVNEVESQGQGFLPNGKAKILFERHVFRERLEAAGHDVARLEAQYPNLINATAGGYAGGTAEWQRLALARQINETAALESASWGAFQIMGYHWQRLGYESVKAFVAGMSESEGQQLEAFVRFILTDSALHNALKARKWAKVAELYNGPAYKRNLYDIKLARAYERHLDDAPAEAA
ncbi:N-acetylmuramidase domain-containing protein [Pseudomonas luteola]